MESFDVCVRNPLPKREVKRCYLCKLNQFVLESRKCRRCHKRIDEPIILEVHPPETKPVSLLPQPSPLAKAYDIATAVLLLRHAAGLTQKQAAMRAFDGKSRTWLTKIENGHSEPTVATIVKLAAAFKISPYRLIRFAQLCAQ